MVRSFVGITETSDKVLSKLSMKRKHSGAFIERLLPCQFGKSSSEASLLIPKRLLHIPNSEFISDVWDAHLKPGPQDKAWGTLSAPYYKHFLEEAVIESLKEYGRVPQAADIAQSFGISERSLARQLAQKGTSFRKALNQTRMKFAKELLSCGNFPVNVVAKRLGYSEASPFIRSFKRQFSVTPAQFRRKEL